MNKAITRIAAAGAVLAGSLAMAGPAVAGTASFNGNCQFSGPISPQPPITLLPVPGSHFSYHASGTCSGNLGGTAISSAPVTVAFVNVSTLFDTCELGPDFNLHGVMTITTGAVTDTFPIVINLARIAIVGPFLLTTGGGGLAVGIAQFAPANLATALQQCAGSGVADASLTASFSTLIALVGSSSP